MKIYVDIYTYSMDIPMDTHVLQVWIFIVLRIFMLEFTYNTRICLDIPKKLRYPCGGHVDFRSGQF